MNKSMRRVQEETKKILAESPRFNSIPIKTYKEGELLVAVVYRATGDSFVVNVGQNIWDSTGTISKPSLSIRYDSVDELVNAGWEID